MNQTFDFNAFKQYLDDNGIKQNFIAQKIGTSVSMLSAILSGRVKCSLDNYVNICFALSVPFGTFVKTPPQHNTAK